MNAAPPRPIELAELACLHRADQQLEGIDGYKGPREQLGQKRSEDGREQRRERSHQDGKGDVGAGDEAAKGEEAEKKKLVVVVVVAVVITTTTTAV